MRTTQTYSLDRPTSTPRTLRWFRTGLLGSVYVLALATIGAGSLLAAVILNELLVLSVAAQLLLWGLAVAGVAAAPVGARRVLAGIADRVADPALDVVEQTDINQLVAPEGVSAARVDVESLD